MPSRPVGSSPTEIQVFSNGHRQAQAGHISIPQPKQAAAAWSGPVQPSTAQDNTAKQTQPTQPDTHTHTHQPNRRPASSVRDNTTQPCQPYSAEQCTPAQLSLRAFHLKCRQVSTSRDFRFCDRTRRHTSPRVHSRRDEIKPGHKQASSSTNKPANTAASADRPAPDFHYHRFP